MATILMRRVSRTNKAVTGAMFIPYNGTHLSCTTLENADYLIPQGAYELKLTYSPRFDKMLPLLVNVPGRSGIRIHTGTKPEHSQGCILVTPTGKRKINEFINFYRNYKDEKTFIAISGF